MERTKRSERRAISGGFWMALTKGGAGTADEEDSRESSGWLTLMSALSGLEIDATDTEKLLLLALGSCEIESLSLMATIAGLGSEQLAVHMLYAQIDPTEQTDGC